MQWNWPSLTAENGDWKRRRWNSAPFQSTWRCKGSRTGQQQLEEDVAVDVGRRFRRGVGDAGRRVEQLQFGEVGAAQVRRRRRQVAVATFRRRHLRPPIIPPKLGNTRYNSVKLGKTRWNYVKLGLIWLNSVKLGKTQWNHVKLGLTGYRSVKLGKTR